MPFWRPILIWVSRATYAVLEVRHDLGAGVALVRDARPGAHGLAKGLAVEGDDRLLLRLAHVLAEHVDRERRELRTHLVRVLGARRAVVPALALLHERLRKDPEGVLLGILERHTVREREARHSQRRLVQERRRGVPRLGDGAHNDTHLATERRLLAKEQRHHLALEVVQDLCRKGAWVSRLHVQR